MKPCVARLSAPLVALLLCSPASAQGVADLPAPGESLVLGPSFSYVDVVIPSQDPPAHLRLWTRGGNGGNAIDEREGDSCTAQGGRGITYAGIVSIGDGPGQIPPGGTLRLIVGHGAPLLPPAPIFPFPVPLAAGGGGGTAILYAPPFTTDFLPLLVAGGGGGARAKDLYNDGCSNTPGMDASPTECGLTPSGALNCGGLGGPIGTEIFGGEIGGGGGGFLTPGAGLVAGFITGGAAGGSTGGAGGWPDALHELSRGGWGFGGGAAAASHDGYYSGGGGGGYSGGGGGSFIDAISEYVGGGGGGSFVDPRVHQSAWFFDDVFYHGFVQVTSFGAVEGGSCADAVALDDTPGGVQVLSASTVGALEELPSSCAPTNGGLYGSWFVYENSQPCDRELQLDLQALAPPYRLEILDGCGTSVLQCQDVATASGSLTLSVPGSASRWIRVASAALDAPFELTVSDVTLGGGSGCVGEWIDQGQALAGTAGDPLLTGEGALQGGDPVSLSLANARPNASTYLVVGLSLLQAPFKGGSLVPAPDLLISPIQTSPTGNVLLASTWPVGLPGGLESHWQFWVQDPAGPVGFAASNGVTAVTP